MNQTHQSRGAGLIFVGGCPRSGTTLVQNVLDSHPEVAGGPEFIHLRDIMVLRNALQRSVDMKLINMISPADQVDDSIATLIESLLRPYAKRKARAYISEKTPDNVLIFEQLLELFPGAHCIFCVRDPRAVVASMFGVGRRASERGVHCPVFTRNLFAAFRTIKHHNTAGFRASEASRQVTVTIYERLVANPERETRRLCDALGLTWSPEMMKSGRHTHDTRPLDDGVWYTDAMFRSDPDPSRADGWRTQLSERSQALLNELFRHDRDLQALRYEFPVTPLPLQGRLAIALQLRVEKLRQQSASALVSMLPRTPCLAIEGRTGSNVTLPPDGDR